MKQKILNCCFYSLVVLVVVAISSIAIIRYGDDREEIGVQKTVAAYRGGIVRLEAPNSMYATGKGVPDIRLQFGLFREARVSADNGHYTIDEDEELPLSSALTMPPPPPVTTNGTKYKIALPPMPK